MIPQHELRIGNWVQANNSGEYYQIKKGIDIDNQSKSFLPVPITPELLERCGFLFNDYFKLWQKNKIPSGTTGPDMEIDPDFWLLNFSRQRIGIELKSFHQLQNLYFYLKGRELEIKDDLLAHLTYAPDKKAGLHGNVLSFNKNH